MSDDRTKPHQIAPESKPQATTLAINSAGVLAYVTSSVPVILLPLGSTSASVPAGTPVGTIVLMKGA